MLKIGKGNKSDGKQFRSKPTHLRKISDDSGSHADIVEANPRADTVKVRTLTEEGKPGTRTYQFDTTHGLSPERVSRQTEERGRGAQEAERHRYIRTKTRQGEITERY